MNLLTLIGAAAGSKEFCELLFDDPLAAARALGLVLTKAEVAELETVFQEENRDELCGQFGKLRAFLCKKSPCPFAVALSGDPESGKESAAA